MEKPHSESNNCSVHLVMDQYVSALGLKQALIEEGHFIHATFHCMSMALKCWHKEAPGVAIIDYHLNYPAGGLLAIRKTRQKFSEVGLVLYSVTTPPALHLARALELNTEAIITSVRKLEELTDAVNKANRREQKINEEARQILEKYDYRVAQYRNFKKMLHPRRKQMVKMIGWGYSSSEIAEELGYTKGYISNERSKITALLDLSGTNALKDFAEELVTLPEVSKQFYADRQLLILNLRE